MLILYMTSKLRYVGAITLSMAFGLSATVCFVQCSSVLSAFLFD